jgi:pilus assembly protein CpaC
MFRGLFKKHDRQFASAQESSVMRPSTRSGLPAMTAMLLASLVCFGPQQAAAQADTDGRSTVAMQSDGSIGRRLNLGVGKSVIIDLPREASEIFVANPKVANAVVRSTKKLYVIAMENGQTTIFATDAQGRQIATIEISVGRDIQELDRILKTAMPNSNIILRTVGETIILGGSVDSAGESQKAIDIAEGFLNTGAATGGGSSGGGGAAARVVNSLVIRGRDQVMLKVTIAEIQRQVMKQLGVTDTVARGSWGSFTQQNPLTLNLQQLTQGSTKLGAIDDLSSNTTLNGLGAQLKAFERAGVARILAEPNVTAISGENAKFTAGGELPVPTSQTCTGGSCSIGMTFKQYGVSLNFTPVVLAEGRILLRVATEVTEVDPTTTINFSSTTASASVNVPAFRTRKNETSVELPSGGSIVSAGLIQSKSRAVINGVPGLMNLPILGTVFRSRDYQRDESELMIMVTPYIVKPVNGAQIAKPTDGFTDATDPQALLLGRVNRLYSTTSHPQIVQGFKGRVGFIND